MPVFSFSLILRSSYHVSKNISLFKSIVIFSCLLAYKSFRQTKQSHAKASVKILQHGQLLCAVWSKATFLLLFLMKEQFFFLLQIPNEFEHLCLCVNQSILFLHAVSRELIRMQTVYAVDWKFIILGLNFSSTSAQTIPNSLARSLTFIHRASHTNVSIQLHANIQNPNSLSSNVFTTLA